MWNCRNCEEKIEDSFDTCWNCGYDKTGEKIMSESFEETNSKKVKRTKMGTPISHCEDWELNSHSGRFEIFENIDI